MPLSELTSLVAVLGCRPDGQLLQSFGQHFELLICAEFVESVDADLNSSGVVVGYIVDVFGQTPTHAAPISAACKTYHRLFPKVRLSQAATRLP
jgi:hypothetical protein